MATPTLNPHIFREYDIRGIADRDLDDDVAYALGRAIGTLARRRGADTFAIGRDTRLSGERIARALTEGLSECGLEVHDIGMVPTPLLYFSVYFHGLDGGIEVTGSHNPAEYNGLKIVIGEETLYGEAIQEIRKLIETEDYINGRARLYSTPCVDPYLDWITNNIKMGPRKLRVVVDAGNGAAGIIMMRLMERLGVEALGYYIEPDGRFPNHAPDPTTVAVGEHIGKLVIEKEADLGLGLDGDGDRLGVVDHEGNIQWGDRLMILFSRAVLQDKPGAKIVSEVKCSQSLYDDIEAHGGIPVMAPVGHSLIKAIMKENGALLAGEMSGHFFFKHRYFGYDDALYAAARLLELLSHTTETLPELLADVPVTYATPELRLPCPDHLKFDAIRGVIETLRVSEKVVDIDGARVIYDDGWGLVRASNTQPVVSLRAEASTPERRDEIKDRLVALVNRHIGM